MSHNGAKPKAKKEYMEANVANRATKDLVENNPYYKETSICDAFSVLSVRLFDVLDMIGASEDFRKFRQECAISQEILHTICGNIAHDQVSSFIFGSSSEGTTTPELKSDVDMLTCFNNTPVVEYASDAMYELSLLMIRDKIAKPGYVKLQCLLNGEPQNVHMRNVHRMYEESDREGRICHKHVTLLGNADMASCSLERNGPADTNTQMNMDFVPSFRCSKIPKFASEWISRQRLINWPTKRMLQKIASMDCFIVGVGHPASDERQIEWRLSFSLQERELMFGMNCVQHKCYTALKIIKKNLIEPKVGKSLSSYHLKTCMFYVMENTKSKIWKRTNLVHCIVICLQVLLQWVNAGYCPNYFIPEENMFDRVMHRTQKINLVRRLRYLLLNCTFLFHISLDHIGYYLKNGITQVRNMRVLLEEMFFAKSRTLHSILNLRTKICYSANSSAVCFLETIASVLSQINRLPDHSEQQTKAALSLITPLIYLQLAQAYASLALSVQSVEDKYRLLQSSGYRLREYGHYCVTLTKLLEVTVVYKLEHYQKCINILKHVELVLARSPVTLCECDPSRMKIYKDINGKQFKDHSLPSILNRTSLCVIFLESDVPIVPDALQFEFYRSVFTRTGSRKFFEDLWFDFAVVDAIIYFHFMKYLAYDKLHRYFHKHVAIHNLELVLKSDRYLGHRETGYNLLGWIHFHEGWIQTGIKYFRLSLAIRPHHNAAKFHMLNIFID